MPLVDMVLPPIAIVFVGTQLVLLPSPFETVVPDSTDFELLSMEVSRCGGCKAPAAPEGQGGVGVTATLSDDITE